MSSTVPQRSADVCTQCRRQKQKCNRQNPCSNCLRRRIPHLCHPAPHGVRPVGAASAGPTEASLPVTPAGDANVASASLFGTGTVTGTMTATSTPTSSGVTPQRRLSETGGSPRARVGHIWNSRGAPSYHSESYFGPQAVAGMMQVDSPEEILPGAMIGVHLTSGAYRRSASNSHHGALSLHAHIWELLGHVPRPKAVVDGLVRRFFAELNGVLDGLHYESFMSHYEAFWQRQWGDDDLLTVDLRWLALLFMVLAFSELLSRRADAAPQTLLELEETSLQFFWASRKCLVIAPTFSGESADLVRAGILITRYLVFAGRKAEAWLTSSFAVRMAQAQGMHVDGENWKLPQEVSQTRRRLWAALYTLDRTLAMALGRPYVIHDPHCMKTGRENTETGAGSGSGSGPGTGSGPEAVSGEFYYLTLQQSLSCLLGQIQDECFGLAPRSSASYQTYEHVLQLDARLLAWADALPPVFRLTEPDTAWDDARPHLYWQRVYLHAQFLFARITLHRTYVVRDSATDRFRYSCDICISAACADLRLKLSVRRATMADRLKASLAAHHLFNSALVLGIITVREPLSTEAGPILADLQAYCDLLAADIWSNDFVLAEVKVIALCIASARKARREAAAALLDEPTSVLSAAASTATTGIHAGRQHSQSGTPRDSMYGNEHWLDTWLGPTGTFPEPVDFRLWEDLVDNLEHRA
ncbi:nuclear protein [Ophiostoma piceae UAMH 11346]|uniref:Nuclear protein n=1 Tax=Ophiostoma piceae (strain UAMH 11346) TaxID=1262450 RepID=S3CD68_OPHP1|nr:nuclear protein [Ophiostoma piceae UAMH 11346]